MDEARGQKPDPAEHQAFSDAPGTGTGTDETSAKRRPGRPPIKNPRKAVSLRLEPEVLEKFRATGPGWQRRINDILKAAKI
ncbi:BrnA antitoxin family protein [Tianweitania sediminis]|jgi:uncharacterized protein (DUF4415 family)|uniref:BrnA antitoxin family protein n=1 Tax=Tianweitania sediminis TaxID=1502156 RepID=A0A8J7ULG3_9HYPH|nr:BrnA antitoxin family protein [Tianweitania sediminis]MBP0439402.1 BrnA antitoxin family protein [Tianweitania sediminis]